MERKKERKYDLQKHRKRLEVIIEKWDEITAVIKNTLPSDAEMDNIFARAQLPAALGDEPLDEKTVSMTVKASKEMRDKYVLARLLWDLGLTDEFCKGE